MVLSSTGVYFPEIGLDAVVGKCVGGGALRLILIFLGELQRGRFPLFFPDIFPEGVREMDPVPEVWWKTDRARRALMQTV